MTISINPARFLTRARKMKDVNRCSGTRLSRPYTLDSHGAFVADLYYLFATRTGFEPTAKQLFYILNHDIMETETGDLLYPAKNLNPKVADAWDSIEAAIAETDETLITDVELSEKFTENEYALFKACDMLELWITCVEEARMGNNTLALRQIIATAQKILDRYAIPCIHQFMMEFV